MTDFDKLHARGHDHAVFLYAFDLLELNGDDLRNEPLEKRKRKLERLLSRAHPGIQYNEHVEELVRRDRRRASGVSRAVQPSRGA